MNWLEIYHVMMKKELYDISMLFKMFKKFEKVVQGWKNGLKWGKITAPESAYIHYYTSQMSQILNHSSHEMPCR